MTTLFFGLGYSARTSLLAMGKADATQGFAGTSRTTDGVAALAHDGIEAYLFDGVTPGAGVPGILGRTRRMIQSIAPTEAGDAVLRCHGGDLDAAARLEWICYYSTVGVYGDAGGDWVDETTPPVPVNARSQWRARAEDDWRAFAGQRGIPLLILRLAGIYGPGRSGFDKLRNGTARRIVKPGQVFNRIHVADIGRVTALAAERRLSGTFNLADDAPAPPQDVVSHAAELLGVDPPPETDFETAEMTPMARSFYSDNKRVSNRAIRDALGIDMVYPSYREGLAAILEAESA